MANRSRFSKTISLILLFILLLGFIGAILVIRYQTELNNSPEDSGAIFGGRLESGYEFAGYVISDLGDTLKICSAIFLSPTQAATAAHCLDNDGEKFVGLGNYTSSRSSYKEIKEVIINPEWDSSNKVENDMGLIILKEPVQLSQYAEIVQPTAGCGYVVVGYGKQDTSDNFTPLRKSADVCIESTNYLGTSISFSGREGGLCFGDSGSGIFLQNTNKLVTIASSIDSCYINNFAAGAQIAGKYNLTTSTLSTSADFRIACGRLDTQNNNVVDQADLDDFKSKYKEHCNDSDLINISAVCGSKDTNSDGVIDLEDLAELAKRFGAETCL